MLIEAARQAETAVKRMLSLVREGSVSCDEIREALAVSRAIAGVNSAFQIAGAASIAGRERHGDGGAEVLASAAGLSRHDARSQVRTAEALRMAPRLREAVEAGRVSVANARRLADAVEKTSAADVESDTALMAKAETLRPEQFTREARRWTVERHGDGGASEHARQRARRVVRVWDGDDGMVHLRGQFDAVTGRRIENRLRAEAGRLYDADKKNLSDSAKRRSFDQCMADALDGLSANTTSGENRPYADICVVAHVEETTGELIAELPDNTRLPRSVLDELGCNADLTGVIYDRCGRAIWRTHTARRATKAQRQMLIARDGGCFACGCRPGICDVHHVKPVFEGGPTKLDNLVLACWACHNKIHHLGWQIHGPPGNRTLHPPDLRRYGPAYAPEHPAPLFNHELEPGTLAAAVSQTDKSPAGRKLKRPDAPRDGRSYEQEPPQLFQPHGAEAPDPSALTGTTAYGVEPPATDGSLNRSGLAASRATLHRARKTAPQLT